MIVLLAFLILGLKFSVPGQDMDMRRFEGMEPRSIGPAGMSGRITAIDVVREKPEHIYIGSASGGLWKSESGGTHWEPLFDDQEVTSIGAVAIDQDNPDRIWVGTGEGNPRNSVTSGYGVYRSLDGGETWERMGLEKTRNIHRIILHDEDPETVYVGAIGSPWGEQEERGLYRSQDGGETWEKILYVNETTGVADLVVDPTNPDKMFAAMWDHRRWPSFFRSGGPGSGLYMTHNGGKDWERIRPKDGIPEGKLGRIGLAIAPSDPDRVYALIESQNNALYRSDDGGQNWKMVNDDDIGGRPFYYADLRVHSRNKNIVYNMYSRVSKSIDGGKNFEVILPYSGVHPDHHAFYIHPDDPDYMIDGNDGGLNISRNGGKNWHFIENLPLAQYYHINVDMEKPYHVYGGMQDNGSWKGPAYVWRRGGIRNAYWEELYFGDGFDVVPDADNPRYGYAMSQGGNLARYDMKTGATETIKPVHPAGKKLRFNWDAAIAQDTSGKKTLYYGSQFLHKSMDQGRSWEIVSPDLTTDDTTKQQQLESGGLTKDVTNAENYTTITAIAPSPHQDRVIWVGTDDGNLQLTKDGGENWSELSDRLGSVPDTAWIPEIRVSKHQKGAAFVVLNDYRRNNWEPYAYKTTDYGKTWERIAGPREVTGPVRTIVQDPEEASLLFLGTERGLYFSTDGAENWNKWTNGFPSVPVFDLKIHPREYDLVAGTFGRAAYVLDDIRPLRTIAKRGKKILKEPLHLYQPPPAYLVDLKQAAGTRFAADGIFKGENRPYGARITFSVDGLVKKEEGGQKEDPGKDEKERGKNKKTLEGQKEESLIKKADVFVRRPEKGDTIRHFRTTVDTGMNRFTWGLRKKGERYPDQEKKRFKKKEPTGFSVGPGEYRILLSYGDHVDSVLVELRPDPRKKEKSLTQEKASLQKEHLALVKAATQATDRLRTAKEVVQKVNKELDQTPDSVKKALKKKGKAMRDSIESILSGVLPNEDIQGIHRDPSILSSRLHRAAFYLASSEGPPNQTQKLLIEQTRKQLENTLKKVNRFFEKDWVEYKEGVRKADLTFFKPYEPVSIGK